MEGSGISLFIVENNLGFAVDKLSEINEKIIADFQMNRYKIMANNVKGFCEA